VTRPSAFIFAGRLVLIAVVLLCALLVSGAFLAATLPLSGVVKPVGLLALIVAYGAILYVLTAPVRGGL
jgi:hypothetical protein